MIQTNLKRIQIFNLIKLFLFYLHERTFLIFNFLDLVLFISKEKWNSTRKFIHSVFLYFLLVSSSFSHQLTNKDGASCCTSPFDRFVWWATEKVFCWYVILQEKSVHNTERWRTNDFAKSVIKLNLSTSDNYIKK
jgi:hypothetical protein